jgi:penicillin-insensitive murein endopeptidase
MKRWLMSLLAVAFTAAAGGSATIWWRSGDVARGVSTELTSEPPAPTAEQRAHSDAQQAAALARAQVDVAVVHPLAAFDDEQVGELVTTNPEQLGSISIGVPNRGLLINGVEFPEGPLWKRADPKNSWGTRESVEFVEFAIRAVNEQFPDSPPLYVGDFSAKRGGRLRPHKSHQSGRDVDLGYYYVGEQVWYRRAHAGNLDRARTWALLKALISRTPVEYVFMDARIQPLLKEYAEAQGEDPEWLSRVFGGSSKEGDPIVRHRAGHATHLHVRFENPTAELTARRSFEWLEKAGLLPGPKGRKKRKGPHPLAATAAANRAAAALE